MVKLEKPLGIGLTRPLDFDLGGYLIRTSLGLCEMRREEVKTLKLQLNPSPYLLKGGINRCLGICLPVEKGFKLG